MTESQESGAEANQTLSLVPDAQIYRVSGPVKLWEALVLGGAILAVLVAFWIYLPRGEAHQLLQDSLIVRTTFGLGLTLTILTAVGLARILKSAMAISVGPDEVAYLFGRTSIFKLSTASLILEHVRRPILNGSRLHSLLVFRQGGRRFYFASPDPWQGGSPVRERLIQHLISLGVTYEAPLSEAQEMGDEWPLPKPPSDWLMPTLLITLFLLALIAVGTALGLEVLGYLSYFFVPIFVFLFWLIILFLSMRRQKQEEARSRFLFNSREAKLVAKGATAWCEERDQVRALVLAVRRRPFRPDQFRFELETLYSRRHAITPWLSCATYDPGPMLNRARLVGLPIKLDSEEGSTLLPWDG